MLLEVMTGQVCTHVQFTTAVLPLPEASWSWLHVNPEYVMH